VAADRKPEKTREEWLAGETKREAAFQRRIAARKAEEERLLAAAIEADAEIAAEADPAYLLEKKTQKRKESLKGSVLSLITKLGRDGPVLRSCVYETLNGGRHKDIFDQVIQELLEAESIIQTECRTGTRGRIGVAYLPGYR